MATLRQINANKINSQNSTGPKSEEGKEASRANALKHGLAGDGIVLPDEEQAAVAERIEQWHSSLRPFTVFDIWLVELVATESVRVERCRAIQASLREENARRAGEGWAEDRRLAASRIAAKLANRPEVFAPELAATTHGVDLLIERWRSLAAALETRDWNSAERVLALDLLGFPRALRDAPTPLDAAGSGDGLRRFVAEQIAGLLARKPVLDDRDGRDQAVAMLGHAASCPEQNRVRRYETSCLRRLQWAYSRLKSAPAYQSKPVYNPILPKDDPDDGNSPLLTSGRLADSGSKPPMTVKEYIRANPYATMKEIEEISLRQPLGQVEPVASHHQT